MSQMTLGQALQEALAHHQAGRMTDAENIYRRILAAQPNQPDALHLLGLLGTQIGQVQPGIAMMRQAVTVKPEFPAAWSNLGAVLLQTQQTDDAITCLRRAVELQGNQAEAHYLLAHALREKLQFEEALNHYRQALTLHPDHADAPRALAALLREMGRFEESLAAAQASVDRLPDYVAGINEIGSTLEAQGKFDEAAAAFRKALAIQPDYLIAQNNLGTALSRGGHLEEAVAAFRRAVELDADRPEVHINLAQALLRQGDLSEGFRELEWRWKLPGLVDFAKRYPRPRWDGSNPNGRIILLTSEPGLSDTLQFVRYAPLLSRQGATVIVECQPELKTLLSGMADVDRVIGLNENPELIEIQCPLASVPMALGTTLDTIPNATPYIKADPASVGFWASRVAEDRNLKIGVAWVASTPQGPDRASSIAYANLSGLLETPNVSFYSLQVGPLTEEFRSNAAKLIDWTAELHNFSDLAALMANLDLIITIDSPLAHLAGAMARPVWLMLRYAPDWRWMLTRTDSPWYPTMRLFGQQEFGDWTGVIRQIGTALAEKTAPQPPRKTRRKRAPAKPKEE